MLKKIVVGFIMVVGLAGAAFAQGLYPGFPAATSVDDSYLWAADTQLSGGQAPQTVDVTAAQMKNYVFGNTAAGTVTATGNTTANAATLNAGRGKVTSTALTNAAAASTVLTLTNSTIAATSIVLVSVGLGTATTGEPVVASVVPGAGTASITIKNVAAAAAFNGTVVISYAVVN